MPYVPIMVSILNKFKSEKENIFLENVYQLINRKEQCEDTALFLSYPSSVTSQT